jgi:N-acetylglucosaminyl-diphospho-decaprenol L-rhamnosyltransferase
VPPGITAPDITVLVVTWNGRHFLERCLDSLRRQSMADEAYEVLVVDNASTDGTAELLAADYPKVRLVTSPVNTGFAGGCRLGMAATRAPTVVLLNNDAVAEPDFLERIIEPLSDPAVGATTARVLLMARFRPARSGEVPSLRSPDGDLVEAGPGDDPATLVDVVNSTGNVVDARGYGRDRGWLEIDGRDYGTDVFSFCGAAAALNACAVASVGGFDEDFFLYYEDVDLSWRLRLGGYRVAYVPNAVVRHHHSGSSVEGSPLHRFYDHRNRLLTLTKNAPACLALQAVLREPLTTLSIARTERAHLTQTRLRARAWLSYLRLLPRMLRRRRQIGRMATVSRAEVANRPSM